MNEQLRFGQLFPNHNETVVADHAVRLGLDQNHNESVVADPCVRLGSLNHNETVVADR